MRDTAWIPLGAALAVAVHGAHMLAVMPLDAIFRDTTFVDGQDLISFASYNYLRLSGDPDVSAAAAKAAASADRCSSVRAVNR